MLTGVESWQSITIYLLIGNRGRGQSHRHFLDRLILRLRQTRISHLLIELLELGSNSARIYLPNFYTAI